MPTKTIKMADIAKMAGVTKPVVSAVLNDSKTIRMSDKKRKEIQGLIRKYNFLPSATARNLARKKTMTIALVIPSMHFFEVPEYAQIATALQEKLTGKGYRLQVVTLANYFEEYKLVNRVEADGAIVMYWGRANLMPVDELKKHSMPVLTLLSRIEKEGINNLFIDSRACQYEQAKQVIAAGHRNILHPWIYENQYYADGHGGIRQAVAEAAGVTYTEAKLPFQERGTAKMFSFARAVVDLVRTAEPRPTAVMFDEDRHALAAINAMREAGLRVPEDISITGNLRSSLADFMGISLKTTENVSAILGSRAAEMTVKTVQGDVVGPVSEAIVPGQLEGTTLGSPAVCS